MEKNVLVVHNNLNTIAIKTFVKCITLNLNYKQLIKFVCYLWDKSVFNFELVLRSHTNLSYNIMMMIIIMKHTITIT